MAKVSSKKKSSPEHSHSSILSPEGFINVSQSKVNTWRRCRRAFHYKYIEQITPKKRKRPFMFGGIVHEMCEAHFEKDDPFEVLEKIELDNKKLFKREIEMYGNIIEDIRYIMTDYFDHYEGSLKPIKWNGRRSEHEFRIELDYGLWFTGRIDALVKAKKLKWLQEHKSFKRQPGEDDRWRSVQGATYLRAVEMTGGPALDGVLWDYISSKPPVVPTEILKDGSFSKKKVDSLPSSLKAWIKKNGFKKSDYKKLLDEAVENRDHHFIRVFSPLRPRVVDLLWNDFVDTAHEIQELHLKSKTMSIGWGCRMCEFQPLCKAEAHGTDVEFVKRTQYMKETDDHKRDQSERVSED
jgi:hypothetical protein